jgi:hypothetical protein
MPMAIVLDRNELSTSSNKADYLQFNQDQRVRVIGLTYAIGCVHFGSRKDKRPWIVFQRSNEDWPVRIRSNLWFAEGDEITFSDIPLRI